MSSRLLARTSLVAGALASMASRTMGLGAGELIGGRVALAICPDVLAHLGSSSSTVLVSGTNGKTTTTRMCAVALQAGGFRVSVSNEGSNLPPGLVSVLARGDEPVWRLRPRSGSRGSRGSSKLFGVLEVDEAWLPKVAPVLSPEVVILTNLTRDQLDRVSEVRKLSAAWRVLLEGLGSTLVVANADDPLVAWAAQVASRVCWVAAGRSFGLDSVACPNCGGLLEGDPWRCVGCGFSRPEPDVRVSPLSNEGSSSYNEGSGPEQANVRSWLWGLEGYVSGTLSLRLPGSFNAANAAMALAGAKSLGAPLPEALRALASLEVVSGRYGVVSLGGVPSRLLLAKNPAGFVEALGILTPDRPVVVGINARVADGRDPSWLWDVPFERLAGKRTVIAAGDRCWDLSVRLHYAEVAHQVEGDLRQAARLAAEGASRGLPKAEGASRGASEMEGLGEPGVSDKAGISGKAGVCGEIGVPGGAGISGEIDMLLNYTAFAQARAVASGALALGGRRAEATALWDRWGHLVPRLALPRKKWSRQANGDDAGSAKIDLQIPQSHESELAKGGTLAVGRARPEKFVIVNVFPDLLGTYGDGGNALVLAKRLQWRGIPCEVLQVSSQEALPRTADIYCIGGGEDAPQVTAARLLREGGALKAAVARGAVVLAVCAGFQLAGESFADGEGNLVEGLGILPVRSQRSSLPRAVGELLVSVTAPVLIDWGVETLIGFENHAGCSELLGALPLGAVRVGRGNSGEGLEGAMWGKVIGTYLHGPVLARNPRLGDFLLSLAIGEDVGAAFSASPSHPREPERLLAADNAASQLRAERLAFLGRPGRGETLGRPERQGTLKKASKGSSIGRKLKQQSLRQKLSRI